MQDTFWTPELWCEFLNQKPLIGALETEMEQFKSSKSPKKEWEIVAYRVGDKNVYYPEYTDDIGRIWGNAEWKGAFIDSTDVNHPDVKIFSVRRLSDDWTVSVKDKVKTVSGKIGTIQAINADGHILFSDITGLEHITTIQKLPQPILTSDGAEISNPETEIWVLEEDTIGHFYAEQAMKDTDRFKGMQIFSTREAAEEYILNSRPLLSLNDVKEAIGSNDVFGTLALRERLTALVKQKLNQ